MPPKARPVPRPRQIETRTQNKTTHPGEVCKPAVRRTSAEGEQERDAKAKATQDLDETKRQSIVLTDEFEAAEIANEDTVDITPPPPYTPKPWPPPHARLVPITESSDVEMGDEFDRASFSPKPSEHMATEDESAVEPSDDSAPPAKRQKGKGKAVGKVRGKEKAGEGQKVQKEAPNVNVSTDDEEQTPKPKPKKVRVCDE